MSLRGAAVVKRLLVVLAILIVLACAFGGYAVRLYLATRNKPDEAAAVRVERGPLEVKVVETGTIDAVKSVEVKSRVAGRLARLLVDEGDRVQAGQLIAIIDPKETQFKVEMDRAQLRGAQSGVARTEIELDQRRRTAQAALRQAEARVAQVEKELGIQPLLSRTAVRQAQAALDAALKERERLISTAHPNQRTAAETALAEAQANLENAEREYRRQEGLVEKGYAAQKSLDNAKLALELARARMRSAKETLERLDRDQKLELERVEQDLERARAELERAKANQIADEVKRKEYEAALASLESARAGLRDVDALRQSLNQTRASVDQVQSTLNDSLRQLGETEIRAPISGVVTQKLIQEGELVASLSSFSSGTPIVRIEDRKRMMVKLAINEIDVARLTLGMPAEVAVDALPGRIFRGRVSKIAPSSTAMTASAVGQTTGAGAGESVVKYSVEVEIGGSDPALKSGMSAKCTMIVLRRKDALRVPIEYVGKDEEGSFVMAKAKDPKAKAVKRRVQTGASSGAFIEIVSGVEEGTALDKPPFTGPKRQGAIMTGPEEGQE
ncbi:MAG: efflux RND transporter periplasmic adaptor subunit [Fimbriimonadales bacterium]|nr:efflux RND transporter periplasmic adaptor subunit [Fimbriimonadales bacterium]